LSDRQELTLDKRLNWIAALSNQVSALTSDCAALVEVVLSWQWSAWEDLTLAQAYAQFLEHLVSAHAFYVVPTMRSLVACFHYRRASSFAHLVNESDGMTLKEKAAEITRQVYNHVHQTLYRILELIPTSALKLAKVLSESFPYQRESARVQTTYLKNMLRVLNYAPILRDAVMRAIVERILQVDVGISLESSEHVD
jgi:RNA polymerase I-specific transcription initiation factor RRN3